MFNRDSYNTFSVSGIAEWQIYKACAVANGLEPEQSELAQLREKVEAVTEPEDEPE